MKQELADNKSLQIIELENKLAEAEQLIEAIKAGEVDAFAILNNNEHEVYTLQSGDYAYRVLIEKFGEGALNLTEDGLIVYTNTYFCGFLGLPYEKVVGTEIFDYIADDSKDTFKHLFTNALNRTAKGEINLMINGSVTPVYVSLTSLQPHLPTIGMITTDLTEKKKMEMERIHNEKVLAAKNIELQNQNAELASFSYIASHDLQEPLRKIQAFTSRILEKESNAFSQSGLDYFSRIVEAAARMQKLIEALLNYSRTNTTAIVLNPTDLNIVLEDVKNDLKDEIETHNVIIESEKLPTLNIFPLQFHQLFSNIISNAIKYHKPGIQPEIRITQNLISSTVLDEDAVPGSKFWKISIQDNGIGFAPEHKNKIFDLFQRLHGKDEYEGTGIGLAICKKIMQNHHGFIKAEGKQNEGATFHIYVPVDEHNEYPVGNENAPV
jgi:PAS domain S-box-containing protein